MVRLIVMKLYVLVYIYIICHVQDYMISITSIMAKYRWPDGDSYHCRSLSALDQIAACCFIAALPELTLNPWYSYLHPRLCLNDK